MISLRQRIRYHKINCIPWKRYKYEVERLPVSAQCLFAKTGISYDVLETELIEEGWLFPGEELLECLQNNETLLRRHLSEIESQGQADPFDESWTEEDYISFYDKIGG